MKFEIKNRYSGELIIAVEAKNWRFAVELALKQKADLSSADLHFANLSYADLRHADLSSADLRHANLSYADLRCADLSSADLRYADLRSADLSYADLRSADLSSADLRSADLSFADLRHANLSYADLSFANLSSATGFKYSPLQVINTKYFITIMDDYVLWGCRKMTFDEIKTFKFLDCTQKWDENEFKLNKKIITEMIRYYRK